MYHLSFFPGSAFSLGDIHFYFRLVRTTKLIKMALSIFQNLQQNFRLIICTLFIFYFILIPLRQLFTFLKHKPHNTWFKQSNPPGPQVKQVILVGYGFRYIYPALLKTHFLNVNQMTVFYPTLLISRLPYNILDYIIRYVYKHVKNALQHFRLYSLNQT
jgi:hypothetical protein